jgi:hypothetical protein
MERLAKLRANSDAEVEEVKMDNTPTAAPVVANPKQPTNAARKFKQKNQNQNKKKK